MDIIYLYVNNGEVIVLKPGDVFEKFSYDQLPVMTDVDFKILGIRKMTKGDLTSTFSIVDFIAETKIEESFVFRGERYKCSSKDISFVNLASTIARFVKKPNGPHWATSEAPFYMITAEGHRRAFDLATLQEFSTQMMFHIAACKLSAEYLKLRISDGEEIENLAHSMHWPAYDLIHTAENAYVSIVNLMNNRTSVDAILDDDYAEQLLEIQRMLE